MLKIIANDLRKASSVNAIVLQSLTLFLRYGSPVAGRAGHGLRISRHGAWHAGPEFVEQYAERTKRVIDRECSNVKKHEQDLVDHRTHDNWVVFQDMKPRGLSCRSMFSRLEHFSRSDCRGS